MKAVKNEDGWVHTGYGLKCHVNSLEAKAMHDPELRRRIADGRYAANQQANHMEGWFRGGFGPQMQL